MRIVPVKIAGRGGGHVRVLQMNAAHQGERERESEQGGSLPDLTWRILLLLCPDQYLL